MMKSVRRISFLIIKELLTLFRDPKARIILIAPPLLQLLVFAFAATLDVKNVSVAIFNKDSGRHGYEVIQRVKGSPTFKNIFFVKSDAECAIYIDEQRAVAAITIPQEFSRDIEAGNQAKIGIMLDGRRSNSSQIVNGYITSIIQQYTMEVLDHRGEMLPSATIIDRNFYNENLLYRYFTVPSLIGILSMLITLIVTSLSVAREKELGTFDQLLVSPLNPFEILIGKMAPAVLVGLSEGLLIWTVAVTAFAIPFKGSFLLLLLTLFVFIMSVVGIGLFISSISKTQQQAILGAFVFMVPAVTLSGYAAPVENMPHWLQIATWMNPLKHVLIIIKGIFLKDMSFVYAWENIWPLIVIGSITLSLSGFIFSRRLQ